MRARSNRNRARVVKDPATDAEWSAWLNDQADQAAKLGARLRGAFPVLLADVGDRIGKTKRYLRG